MKKYSIIILITLFYLIFYTPGFAQEEAGAQNIIQSLNILDTDTATFITLTASGTVNYTLFKMEDFPRVTIDLGNASMEELKSSYSVDNGIIKNIKVVREVEGGLPISRLEINLEKLMEFSATSEDNKLLITVSKIKEFKAEEPEGEKVTETEEELLSEAKVPEAGAEELAEPTEGATEPETLGLSEELPEGEVSGVETLTAPPVSGEEVVAVAPLPTETAAPEEEIITEGAPEELSIEGGETFEEGEIPVEGAGTVEGELPVETPPAILTQETAEAPAEEKSIEEVIEKSEEKPAEETAVVAQVPPPPVEKEIPPPVLEKKERIAWIEGNRIVTSKKLRFRSNEAVLPEEYEPVVKEIAKIILSNPNMKIRIEGYTDNAGDAGFNRALSEYRAIWIKLLLEKEGVNPDRIKIVGMGEKNPVGDNKTEAGREKNRRVEFVITQK